jgi:nitrogen fixation NifU-like protein
MSLEELYQETIIDHSRTPRNLGALSDATHQATGNNPICGDRVTVYLKMTGDTIQQAQFTGEGCAISKASASLMTDTIRGLSTEQTEKLSTIFQKMVTGKSVTDAEKELLGKLTVFSGVGEFPARVKCATMVWHTFFEALNGAETHD